jgi:hypothetical protein
LKLLEGGGRQGPEDAVDLAALEAEPRQTRLEVADVVTSDQGNT